MGAAVPPCEQQSLGKVPGWHGGCCIFCGFQGRSRVLGDGDTRATDFTSNFHTLLSECPSVCNMGGQNGIAIGGKGEAISQLPLTGNNCFESRGLISRFHTEVPLSERVCSDVHSQRCGRALPQVPHLKSPERFFKPVAARGISAAVTLPPCLNLHIFATQRSIEFITV